jgi:hypothetical protein
MKLCPRCNIPKQIGDYRPSQYKKNGGWCRLCCKEYEDSNKERKSNYNKEYSKIHKDIILQNKKDNKTRSNLKQKERRDKNREIYKTRYLPRMLEYKRNRRKYDPQFRLREMLSSRIHQALKSSKQNNSISNFLPYTIQNLKSHIESKFEQWMTWDNWGVYDRSSWNDNNPLTWTWNIDHIIPHSFLPYTSMDDDNFKKCWALENLRPLSSKQNVTENNKRII